MSWEKEKLFLTTLGILLLCLMLFLLGVAFGTSTSNAEFKETILPVLSAVGSWVSGVGALGAVLVALWIAEKQRINDKESLKLAFDFVVTPEQSNAVLMISAVSVGKRPSEINSILIYSQGATTQMYITSYLHGSSQIPINLGYGKKAQWLCKEKFEHQIGSYLKTYCNSKASHLEICVSTTTENFIFIPSKEMKKTLESFAKETNPAPERMQENG
jgi:hypothetical protein